MVILEIRDTDEELEALYQCAGQLAPGMSSVELSCIIGEIEQHPDQAGQLFWQAIVILQASGYSVVLDDVAMRVEMR